MFMSFPSLARVTSRVLAGASDIRQGEGRAVLASGLLFFLVLTAVMVLRPARDALALVSGIEEVRVLFLCTLAATLLLSPAFGYLVSRASRRAFLSISLRCCAVILLGFYLCLTWLPPNTRLVTGAVYYVSHSVFNLFLVSLFWAFMADLFSVAESKRLFPAIAVGGTLGAVAGSMISWQLAERIGVAWLFLVAVGLLEAAVWTCAMVARTRSPAAEAVAERRPIGGHALAGITVLVRSPYLLGIGLLIIFTAVISTFLYFAGLRIVEAAVESDQERTALFARINVWVQLATLVAQAFVAGRIMRLVGVGAALAILPLCAAVGLALLAAVPTLAAYTAINALYRAVQRGIARPAQETLFTVVDREEKYKAKSFLDTFVFRAGDAGGAQIERALAACGLGVTGLALAVLPIALVWVALSKVLGRTQSRLDARE